MKASLHSGGFPRPSYWSNRSKSNSYLRKRMLKQNDVIEGPVAPRKTSDVNRLFIYDVCMN